MMILLLAAGALVGPTKTAADTAKLTQLRLVVDSATWSDVHGSAFLPDAYGRGFLAGPHEVRLCDRLSCLVMVPEDSAAGDLAGDLVLGVSPVSGSALASRLEGVIAPRARVEIVEIPAAPEAGSGELPMIYYLESATLAVEVEEISRLELWLRSAGARVFREGEGLVIRFANQEVRIVPGWGGTGPERLTFYLRRENPGNPTYKFGGRARLRFGPGRTANWVF